MGLEDLEAFVLRSLSFHLGFLMRLTWGKVIYIRKTNLKNYSSHATLLESHLLMIKQNKTTTIAKKQNETKPKILGSTETYRRKKRS